MHGVYNIKMQGVFECYSAYIITTRRERVKRMQIPYSRIKLFFVATAQSATHTHTQDPARVSARLLSICRPRGIHMLIQELSFLSISVATLSVSSAETFP
jgi:hypothetical protein